MKTEAERLRELLGISRAITATTDYDAILQLVVDKARAFTDAEASALLLSEADATAAIVASVGLASEKCRTFQGSLNEQIGITLRQHFEIGPEHVIHAAPMVLRGRVRGILAVVGARAGGHLAGVDPRAEEREDQLSVLADQAAIALGHAAHLRELEAALVATDRERDARDEALEKLRRIQERLELALRGADLAMWDWNIASGEVIFNPRWAEMRGYRPEEIRGHVDTWTSGIHPEDLARVKLVLEEHLQGRRADYETEHRVRTKSGQWIWILDRGKVFSRNDRGEPVRMAGTELDITSRKRAEAELRLAEAKSSGIVSIAADAIISIDEDQRITLFNEGAEKIFGYSKLEVAGAPLDILIPERFRAIHRQHVEKFAAGEDASRRMGERGALPIFGLRKSGEEFPADAAISRLEVGDQRILTVVLRDTTEQTRIEREQRFLAEVGPVLATTLEYEDTLSRIAEVAVRELADLCIVDCVEEAGDVRRLKVLARETRHAWAAELLMRLPLDRKRPHMVRAVLETKKPVLVERVTSDIIASWAQSEEHLRALRGLDAKSLVAVPLLAHDRLLGVLALASSTRAYGLADLHLAEELAHRAALSIENARLYHSANRAIQVRDDVLGIVAHDLRSPLNSIVLQASMLRRRDAGPERRSRKPADAIERAASRMNRLIQDLLDVARMEAGRLTVEQSRLRTVQFVSDVLEAQKPLAAAGSLELQVDLAPDLPAPLPVGPRDVCRSVGPRRRRAEHARESRCGLHEGPRPGARRWSGP